MSRGRAARPFGGAACGARAQHPAFASNPRFGSWLFGSGSWVSFLFLYLVACNLPQRLLHTVIFGPLQFPCILSLEENFVQVETLQHRGQVLAGPIMIPLPSPTPSSPVDATATLSTCISSNFYLLLCLSLVIFPIRSYLS